MRKTALVLAAHGSRHEPAVNAQVREWAAQAAERYAFDEVAAAFHDGSPAFADVLDNLSADEVTVVPVMTSAGYYSDIVLPRELARNRRYPQITLRQTVPVGLHSKIPRLIADRASAVLKSHDFPPRTHQDVTLAIVGHGTPRHPASRSSTLSLTTKLRATYAFGEVIALFLDDQPPVDELLKRTTNPCLLVIPFLIAPGPHATSDIPKRIGVSLLGSNGPPLAGTVAGRRVICDVPFGGYSEMIELIMDLALSTWNHVVLPSTLRDQEVA